MSLLMLKQTGLRDHLYGYALERFDVVKSSICSVSFLLVL